MTGRWYVSFHGGDDHHDWNNIHRFSVEGEPLGTALETRELPRHVALRELRGFAFGLDGDLYVANAFKDASQVLRFRGRTNDAGKHDFVGVFSERHAANKGLDHPFDVAFGPDGDVYVPSQDTSIVGRYHGPQATAGRPGTPMDHPPALRAYPPDTFHPGTFVPSARHVPTGLREVRHALFGPDGHLYVADRNANHVKRYDGVSGELLAALGNARLGKPVHLLFRDDGTLLVGSRDGDAVLALDPEQDKFEVLIEPGAGGLREPAGLAFGADGLLYVASRGTRQVLRFDPRSGRPDRRPFLDGLDDRPEFLRLVPDPPSPPSATD